MIPITDCTFCRRCDVSKRFALFPAASDRDSWQKAAQKPQHQKFIAALLKAADELLTQPVPQTTLALLMDYVRKGDRVAYETPYFAKRDQLGVLVIAECLTSEGKYLEQIMEYIWSLLSEPSWGLPAHVAHPNNDPIQPPEADCTPELFAIETGMVLAYTTELLGPTLTQKSASLVARIIAEIDRRIVKSLEQHDQWYVFGKGNWSTWSGVNLLAIGDIVLANDVERRRRFLEFVHPMLMGLIDDYPEDGACDEGAMYSSAASLALVVYFNMLHTYAPEAVENYCLTNHKFRNMVEYITKVRLYGNTYTGYSDTVSTLNPASSWTQLAGTWLQSGPVAALARYSAQQDAKREWTSAQICDVTGDALRAYMYRLFYSPDLEQDIPTPVYPPATIFADTQLAILRECPTQIEQGFIAVFKGGYNAEAHNHNDLGHLALYCDASPIILDLGGAHYTRDTFTDKRYTQWNIRGEAHNAPIVNGVVQLAGAQYRTAFAGAMPDQNSTQVAFELKSAYPPNAAFASLVRTVKMDNHKVILADDFVTDTDLNCQMVLYTQQLVEQIAPDQLKLGKVILHLTNWQVAELVKVPCEQDGIKLKSYRGELTRITLQGQGASYYLEFTR